MVGHFDFSSQSISELPFLGLSGSPSEIVAGPDGKLWFVDSIANLIARVTPAAAVTEFPVPPPRGFVQPLRIAAGPDGNMWFTERLAK